MGSNRKSAPYRIPTAGSIAVLAVFVLQACVSGIGTAKPPEEIVKQRAEARWRALLARDWETAYTFLSPAYRKAVAPDHYKARQVGAVVWKSAEVKSVSCSESTCEARVTVVYDPVMFRQYSGLKTDVPERWDFEDGDWWVFQKH